MRKLRIIGIVMGIVLSLMTPTISYAQQQPIQFERRTYGEVPMSAGPIQHIVYEMMIKCTGVTNHKIEDLNWIVADFITSEPSGSQIFAFWQLMPAHGDVKEVRTIYIQRKWMNNPTILAHEIMHDLYDGDPRADIYERCMIRNAGYP